MIPYEFKALLKDVKRGVRWTKTKQGIYKDLVQTVFSCGYFEAKRVEITTDGSVSSEDGLAVIKLSFWQKFRMNRAIKRLKQICNRLRIGIIK